MKLFISPGACSLSPHIVLLEAGLDFTTEQVDLRKKVTAGGADYLAVNPKGYVPALDLGNGVVLTEGPAIVQYVADLAPARKLAPPPGSLERYQLIEWLNFISAEIHKSFGPLFTAGASEDMKLSASASLVKRFGYIEQVLAGRDYLMGAQFSVADAYLFTVVNWAGVVHFDLAPYPRLRAHSARVAARPAVQQALRAEGLLE
ncbi:MAG TPA: glutathione transferase GstA [Telluria sp.]|nr:glutathione transferase GstA [Telluria sp.]